MHRPIRFVGKGTKLIGLMQVFHKYLMEDMQIGKWKFDISIQYVPLIPAFLE